MKFTDLTFRLVAMLAIKFLMISMASLAFAVDPPAATKPVGSDKPEAADLEVARRGTMAQQTGVVQDGPEAAVAQALAPPDDDSDKWWFTLITCGDSATPQVKAQCKLLHDDVAALKFKQWVKPEDPENSWSHYQEIQIDNPTQQDWLAPILEHLKATGLPAVVIQPPHNGQFGPNANIVAIVGGYDGNPTHFAAQIEQRVKAYTDKQARKGEVQLSRPPKDGHLQSTLSAEAGGKPPFELPKPVAYPPIEVLTPIINPAVIATTPKPVATPAASPIVGMTYSQIREAFPDVPPEDADDYARRGFTRDQIVAAENAIVEAAKKKTVTPGATPGAAQTPSNQPSSHWTATDTNILLSLVATILGGIIVWPKIRPWIPGLKQKNQTPPASGPRDMRSELDSFARNSPLNATNESLTRNTPSHPDSSQGSSVGLAGASPGLGVYSPDSRPPGY